MGNDCRMVGNITMKLCTIIALIILICLTGCTVHVHNVDKIWQAQVEAELINQAKVDKAHSAVISEVAAKLPKGKK